MESGDLRVFQAVAAQGSITKAAEQLNYVQSNVTNRIKQLEKQLNTTLFYRTNRGMKLTVAGERLLDYADRILNLLEEADKSTQFSDKPAGPLRLGSLETTAATHLPNLLSTYHKKYPEVKISLKAGHTSDLLQKVLHYEVDGAFVSGPIDHPEIKQLTAFEEELVLISEPCDMALKALLQKPILAFSMGCSNRERLNRWLRDEGVPTNNYMEFGTLEAIIGGVSAGLGISLLAKSSIENRAKAGEIQTHAVPDPYRHSTVLFIYRRDAYLTNAFLKLIDLINKEPIKLSQVH